MSTNDSKIIWEPEFAPEIVEQFSKTIKEKQKELDEKQSQPDENDDNPFDLDIKMHEEEIAKTAADVAKMQAILDQFKEGGKYTDLLPMIIKRPPPKYEEVEAVVEETLKNISEQFPGKELNRNLLVELRKMKYPKFISLIPDKLAEWCVPKPFLNYKHDAARDQLLDVLNVIILRGPESDSFDSFVQGHNVEMNALTKINEINISMKDKYDTDEVIKSLTETVKSHLDPRCEFIPVKSPDKIKAGYIQHKIINQDFIKEYSSLLEQNDDPSWAKAINAEIEDVRTKAEIYSSILDLELFTEVFNSFSEEVSKGKRFSRKGLTKMARSTVERILNIDPEVPFPGYLGNENNANSVYINYSKYKTQLCIGYNRMVIVANNASTFTDSPDYKQILSITDIKAFLDILMIVMGRLYKKLSKDTSVYNKNLIYIYFDLFCRIGTDLFTTEKFVSIVNPLIEKL